MRITGIDMVQNDEWLETQIRVVEPGGSLTLKVRRNSGFIWLNRLKDGEATLAFIVSPGNRRYGQDELLNLVDELSKNEFMGIGNHGQLLFDHGVEAQASAHLEPRDLLDNSSDDIHYSSDVPISGVGGPSEQPN